jgi:hypothetical protein
VKVLDKQVFDRGGPSHVQAFLHAVLFPSVRLLVVHPQQSRSRTLTVAVTPGTKCRLFYIGIEIKDMRCSPNEYISVTGVWISIQYIVFMRPAYVRGSASSFEEVLRNSYDYIQPIQVLMHTIVH